MGDSDHRAAGTYEILHTVRSGESLSLITRQQQARGWPIDGWQPIYRITRLRTGLWATHGTAKQHDNPDLVHPGDVLIIPRSLQGYRLRLNQIQQLAGAIWREKNEVSAIREDMERYSKRLDLISDVLQLVVTCGATAIRSARAAKTLTGIAAETALSQKREAYKEIGKNVKKFMVEHGADAINENLGKAVKAPESVHKAVEIGKAAVAVERVKNAAMVFARGVDFILDWVSPSQIAKFWIQLRTGQSPDGALNQMELAFEQRKADLMRGLADKAHEMRHEQHVVYGSS